MGDNAREFKIKITSSADNAAIQTSAAALQGVSKETAKLGEANEEGAKHAEHSGLSHRALHQILHLIGKESGPEAGAAISGLAAAGTGSILVAIMAVHQLFTWIESIKKASEETAAASAESWMKQRDSIDEAARSAEDFAKGLEHSKTATAEMKEAFAQEKAVLEAQIEGHKKLIDAIEKEQLAEAGGDKGKEQQIKERFEDLKREYDITAEILKLQQARENLRKLEGAQGGLAAGAEAAEKSKESAMGNQGAAILKARVDAQDEKKLKVAYDEAIERIEKSASGPTKEAAEAEAQAMKNEDADVQAFIAYENDKKAVQAHERRVRELTAAAEKAIKARDDNTAAIEQQTGQISKDAAVVNEHEKSLRNERAIGDIGRLGGAKEIPGLVESGVSNMQALLHGQKLSSTQTETNQVLTQLMGDLGYSSQASLRIMNALAHNQSGMKGLIADLERRIAGLEGGPGMKGSTTGQ